jgi:hypothetical protein
MVSWRDCLEGSLFDQWVFGVIQWLWDGGGRIEWGWVFISLFPLGTRHVNTGVPSINRFTELKFALLHNHYDKL